MVIFQHLIDKNTKLREKNGEKVLQMRETVELFINTNSTVRFDSKFFFLELLPVPVLAAALSNLACL